MSLDLDMEHDEMVDILRRHAVNTAVSTLTRHMKSLTQFTKTHENVDGLLLKNTDTDVPDLDSPEFL